MNIKYDNLFFTILGKIMEVMYVGILWIIFSIPIVTIGASSTALYYTVHKVVFKNESYIFSTFTSSFKSNFKDATIKWGLGISLIAFLSVDIIIVRSFAESGSIIAAMIYPLLIILVFVVMCIFSVLSYSARFDDSIKASIYKSAVLVANNLGWMIFLLIILFMALYIIRFLVFFTILLPGAYCCLIHYVFEHIYKKIGWIEEEKTEHKF